MSLIAGSYEKYIWGFKLKPLETPYLVLTPLFSYPSHQSPITTVAACGHVAASGGADDTIHLYDLPSASYLGSLHDHSSSLTSLSFFSPPNLSFPRNLISAASDGSVSIFDADPFVLLKSIRPHRKAINDLSVHPSGKLALTVARDECLAMLNLVRGRRSFCCRLGREASLVKFDLGGDRFFMVVEDKVGVHEAEDARLLAGLLLPIIVLEMPSVLLMAAVRNVPVARPTLYQVVKEMIDKMGYEVRLVRVTRRVHEAYFAQLYLTKVDNGTECVSFDLRPSDAINIAVRCKVPIQVNKYLAYSDGMKVIESGKLLMQTLASDGLLFTEMDRASGQPCIETKEFDLVRNMLIAVVEERYRDAAQWRDKLSQFRAKRNLNNSSWTV